VGAHPGAQGRRPLPPLLGRHGQPDAAAHRLWHGTILPVDDPWWETHFPPCGWNCRCTVVQLGERELHRFGYKVSKAAPAEGPPRDFVRTGTGEVVRVPAGIDPGWAYNPGASAFSGIREKAEQTVNRIATVDVGRALSELVYFAKDPSVDFGVTIGRAGAESPAELSDFSRQLGVSEVRHILNSHGPDSGDELPVAEADLQLIPRILANGMRTERIGRASTEQAFALEIDGVFYVYIERIGKKRGRVMGRTLFKTASLARHYRGGGK
jgi:hypothetical protein